MKPYILICDDLRESYLTLMEQIRDYQEGRLLSEFEFLHFRHGKELIDWYRKNRGKFVSLVVQDIDFTHLQDEELLTPEEWGMEFVAPYDVKALQGFIIFSALRKIDKIVPVLFLSLRVGIASLKKFANLLVGPGYGRATFVPMSAVGENFYPSVVRKIDFFALRPVGEEKKKNWEEEFNFVIGESRLMSYVVGEIEKIAPSDATVMLLGEPGVGKELVARIIHRLSLRFEKEKAEKREPLTVNIAALDYNLIEDELFGHERGAFTGAVLPREGIFESANTSTVFLDEIGELSSEIQIKLLRALEYKRIKRLGASWEREIDIRIIAATNQPLEKLSQTLRPDFYSRLFQHCLLVPSLKERWGNEAPTVVEKDLDRFSHFFIRRIATALPGKKLIPLSPSGHSFLFTLINDYLKGENSLFEGNVRTLRNILERAYERALAENAQEIDIDHLIPTLGMMRFLQKREEGKEEEIEKSFATLNLQIIEKKAIKEALAKTNGQISRAAELLGIHRETLRKKIIEYNL
ncbi:MAG: sigma 54-interacting transcriptional regulator [candidate division WOR-3 bacterium]